MSAVITAARALTTGTMIAATAATVGIGVHLSNAHTAALTSATTAPRSTRLSGDEGERHHDDGGLLGGLLGGSGSTSQGGTTAQSGTSSSVTGGSVAQTRTSGS